MGSREERQWERMRQVLAAQACGREPAPFCSQRTLFGIKSSMEEQVECIVAADEARRRFAASPRKAVIFDLDGTLLDTLPDLVNVTNRALRERGFEGHTEEEIKSYVGNGLKVLLRRAAADATPEEIAALFARWQEISDECGTQLTRPYPGIPEVLAELREAGCALGVVSNKVDHTTQEVIPRFFAGVFGAVHGEGPEYPRKPDPTGLLKTIAELGATPRSTAYVGDSPGDVETAVAAGCLAVAATWGYRPREELRAARPHLMVDDPVQLASLLDA